MGDFLELDEDKVSAWLRMLQDLVPENIDSIYETISFILNNERYKLAVRSTPLQTPTKCSSFC